MLIGETFSNELSHKHVSFSLHVRTPPRYYPRFNPREAEGNADFGDAWTCLYKKHVCPNFSGSLSSRPYLNSDYTMERLRQVASHLDTVKGASAIKHKNADDVVIVAAYRTAMTKGFKGGFKDTATEDLLIGLVKGLLSKTPKFDPKYIEDVAIGNVLNGGAGAFEHRAAMLAAGISYEAAFVAVNRQCSSGLIAVNDIANKILTGQIACGLAGGVESMSQKYDHKNLIPQFSELIANSPAASKCNIPMGLTNENVAEKYNIDRAAQDAFSAASYHKAEQAVTKGLFKDEIIPVQVKTAQGTAVIDTDEGPRAGVTAASLGKLKPAFKKDGTTHAGNASQISDGAGAVLLMRRSLATKLGLRVVGKYVATSAVGVPPEIMGVGPAYAIPHVLAQAGISTSDVAVFEINEAFAAQALFCIEHLGLDKAKVNPRGGAIALGHPLGATGARQVATIMRELKTGEIGVTSMCIGTGMGAAAVFVKDDFYVYRDRYGCCCCFCQGVGI
ncbi:hypothetical protein BABINDRAFT_155098 [Babjeviella inositovora NRRL Y-12698]|uniref:acetyl-CoA C-acyltransferase n=1 Tax=Babjeviella inositovora NRRL Y-12698 TaxID=984486 RepID=A0A1E3QMS5_9ASCO|nr:uncharacterized protein BABINDRAFT_155098 [Babjeviella inositovora NRRL Y-12698]ODQ78928.1 hypothetical protein BABINDRAFT_155098 [Babjeviella inositovora NRRL Y-12698]